MHWPGAGLMLIIGFILTALWFSMGLIYPSYEDNDSDEILDSEDTDEVGKSRSINKIISGIAGVMVVSGAIMKMMHWPGSTILLIGGMCAAVLWMFLEFFMKKN